MVYLSIWEGMAGDVVALADTSVEASNPTRSTWFDEVVFPAIMISVVIHHLRISYWLFYEESVDLSIFSGFFLPGHKY